MRHFLPLSILFILSLQVKSQTHGYAVIPLTQSVKKAVALEASTIQDLHPGYPAAWVKKYVAVDLKLIHKDEVKRVRGNGFALNPAQQQLLQQSESGDDITLSVTYYPDNNLPAEVKDMAFTLRIVPDNDAEFPGGSEQLQRYLKANAMDQLSGLTNLPQVKVQFTIAADGRIQQAHLLERSHLPEVDSLLVKTIAEMPNWVPATNADGRTTPQELVFIVTNDHCAYKTLMQ